jgi:hypothetical protein
MLHMLLAGSSGWQADPSEHGAEQTVDGIFRVQSTASALSIFSSRQGMLEAAAGRFDWLRYRPGTETSTQGRQHPTSHCRRLVAVKYTASWVSRHLTRRLQMLLPGPDCCDSEAEAAPFPEPGGPTLYLPPQACWETLQSIARTNIVEGKQMDIIRRDGTAFNAS